MFLCIPHQCVTLLSCICSNMGHEGKTRHLKDKHTLKHKGESGNSDVPAATARLLYVQQIKVCSHSHCS